MTLLLAGPSSVGKSTLMTGPLASRFGIDTTNKMVASQFDKSGPRPTVIHYNIFHGAYHGVSDRHFVLNESILKTILSTGWIDEALVLVASRQELAERMRTRSTVEKGDGHRYEPSRWLKVLDDADVFAVYEDLFLLLDRHRIRSKVVWSSAEADDAFEWSERRRVHHLLRGRRNAGSGRSTEEAAAGGGHADGPSGRFSSGIEVRPEPGPVEVTREDHFFEIFSRLPSLRSVLDMGCATGSNMGSFLYAAERRGADRLVGLDVDEKRIEMGRRISEAMDSSVVWRHRDGFDPSGQQRFDCVALLDVVHRTADFAGLLKTACESSADAVVIGFSDMTDANFCRDRRIPWPVARIMNAFPVIGLSGIRSGDQKFVYSPKAIRCLIEEEIGSFHRFADIASPKGQNLHIYRRKP